MDPLSMWFAYEWAMERAARARKAGDLAGMAIAEGQADHWFVQWVLAQGWITTSPAKGSRGPASFDVTAVASVS